MNESAWQPPPKKNYKAFWIAQWSWADRLMVKESAGHLPPKKNYKAFWIRQCSWKDRFMVKESVRQPPPPKKKKKTKQKMVKKTQLQGVLDRLVQLGRQVNGERECWATKPKNNYKTF